MREQRPLRPAWQDGLSWVRLFWALPVLWMLV